LHTESLHPHPNYPQTAQKRGLSLQLYDIILAVKPDGSERDFVSFRFLIIEPKLSTSSLMLD
jgi:hypothetical protein